MKKILFGLVLLVGGTLFITNYLVDVATTSTDNLASHALAQLLAGAKPEPTPAQNPAANNTPAMPAKTDVVQQVTNTVSPLVKQATETVNNNLPAAIKHPVASISIHDKKTGADTMIETPAQLEAQHQQPSDQQLDEQKNKTIKFRAYYQKPEKCNSPSSQEMRVQCGNDYMRARVKFEELYRQGKL